MIRREFEPQTEARPLLEQTPLPDLVAALRMQLPQYAKYLDQYPSLSTKIHQRYGIDSGQIQHVIAQNKETQQNVYHLVQELRTKLQTLPPVLAQEARDGLKTVERAIERLDSLKRDDYWMDRLGAMQNKFLEDIQSVPSLDGVIASAKEWNVIEATPSKLQSIPGALNFLQERRFLVHRPPEGTVVLRLTCSAEQESQFSLAPEIVLRSTVKNKEVSIPQTRFGGAFIEIAEATYTAQRQHAETRILPRQLLPVTAEAFFEAKDHFGRLGLNREFARYLYTQLTIGDPYENTVNVPTFSGTHVKMRSGEQGLLTFEDIGRNETPIYLIEKHFDE
ncbi:MAG: hypothetical protein HYV32_01160 [Candidatus Kerfeldbacteria bacterium]|nr:hypothetical protein [Candidatus Kerfeldbacteria bacterium]